MSGRPPRRALLIGTSRYQHLPALPSCAVDVAVLAEVLRRPEIGAYLEVRTVLDRAARQVREEIDAFLDSVGPEDLALIYLTGHGLRDARKASEFFFVAADTDPDRLDATGVSATFVNEVMEGCPAAARVAILDCCLSGGFVHGFRVRDEPVPAAGQPAAKGSGGPRGVFVLSSSGPAEKSFAGVQGPDGPRPSQFTDAVVQALSSGLSGVARQVGTVSVAQLQEHVQERMGRLDPPQIPVYSAFGVDGRIVIADAPRGAPPGADAARAIAELSSSEQAELTEPDEPTWSRLLAYYHDHVVAEKAQPRLLEVRAAGADFVWLSGTERLISGDLDDGEMPIPAEAVDWLAAGDHSAELWAGYPAVVLDEPRRGRGAQFAPLLVRRVEITEHGRLRPFGPVLPNRDLAANLLGADEADQLLDGWEPNWRGGEHGRLAGSVRELLTTTFGLGWVQELCPDRLCAHLDLNSPGQGARNIAVLFTVTDDDAFTKGLRTDLKKIEEQTGKIGGTALGLLGPGPAPVAADVPNLVLVTPQRANRAQLDVLRSTMTNPLTVATGPPGTGKSQLVTNVIATAIANGQRVLLASTNNGAVNEVCEKFAEFAPGGLVRTGSGKNQQIEKETLEHLAGLAAAQPGEVATALAKLSGAISEVAALDRELAEGADAEAELARTARELLASCAELAANLPALRGTIEPDPSRWARRARAAAGARWFVGWRRRRLFRQAGLDEQRADHAGCQALAGAAEAFDEQRRARPAAQAQRADREAAEALELAGKQVELLAADLVRAQVRASAHAGQRVIGDLLAATASPRSDWGALRKVLPHVPAWAVTSLSAKRFPRNPALFDLVVIDEASQCSLPSVLPLLFRAERALVIGDPIQLSAINGLDPAGAARVRRAHGLSAGWLDEHALSAGNSAYDAAARACGGGGPLLLDEHYRCHPEIAEVASRVFYGGQWTVLTNTRGRPSLGGPAVRGLDVHGETRRGPGNRSWVNEIEAQRVAEQVAVLVAELPAQATIGVVTPFSAQAKLIDKLVTDEFDTLGDRFLSATVHKFQGGQRDVMVFSLTARGGRTAGAMNWMDKQPELWNVAITRARSHLFVVGDLDLWRGRSKVVAALLEAASSPLAAGGPWDSQLYAALARQPGAEVRIGVPCHGYRADAVVTDSGPARPVLVDPGPREGVSGPRHRRQMLTRCALLGGDSDPGTRVPVWQLIEGADVELPSRRQSVSRAGSAG